MKQLGDLLSFMSSRTLTVWLIGIFIIYYLTAAVWSEEAFASFVNGLRNNIVVRICYIVFLVNVALKNRACFDFYEA